MHDYKEIQSGHLPKQFAHSNSSSRQCYNAQPAQKHLVEHIYLYNIFKQPTLLILLPPNGGSQSLYLILPYRIGGDNVS